MQNLPAGQQWLLDRAAEFFPPVCLLLRNFIDLKSQWNCSFPNWKHQEMFAALRQLEDDGLIEFFQDSPANADPVRIERPVLQAKQIVTDYRAHRPLDYRLTDSGAELWERGAAPDWSVFYKQDHSAAEYLNSHEDDRPAISITLFAMDEDFARLVLLDIAVSHNLLVIPGTEKFSPCGPWQATYWKTLPAGIKVTAIACPGGDEFRLENRLPDKWGRLACEATRRFSNWYVKADDPSFCRESDQQWNNR